MNENSAAPLEILFEKAEEYSNTSIELFKLKAIDKSADVVSSMVAQLVVAIVAALFFIFTNIGLALWIGEGLGKSYYGFFVVGGCYALLTLLALVLKNLYIKEPINNVILSQLLKQKKYD